MTINYSGYVGIGTTNPNYPLDVSGSPYTYGIGITGSGTTGASYGLRINAGSNSNDVAMNICNNSGTQPFLFIRGDGNIGIGTTSPGNIVTISGGSLQFAGTSSFIGSGEGISHGPSSNGLGFITNGTTRLVITNSGGIGIGTTTTGSYALAVQGKLGATEVVVTKNGWSDFVFKKDYNLKPLDKVAEYIAKNKHLEGIPTEAEVKKNGVSVGEMQAKLLQKVEELTLHMIEMKKENYQLKAKLCALEKKIEK
jgi:hypothetical protein